MAIKVRATRTGYYNHSRIKEGTVFTLVDRKGKRQLPNGKLESIVLKAEQQFSDSWMEKLDAAEAEEHEDVVESESDELEPPVAPGAAPTPKTGPKSRGKKPAKHAA